MSLEDDFDNIVIPSRPFVSGMVFSATKCPKCGEDSALPTTAIIKLDGKMYGPPALKCRRCGWQTPREELEQWTKKNMR
jgi:ribosomal protein L40E